MERGPLPDVAARKSGRYAIAEPVSNGDHRAGPGSRTRRGAGPARRARAPRAPMRVSGRAAALGLLLLALTLSYAYPLRVYLAQQAEIRQLESDQRAQREHIQQLVEQVARWNDEDYVVAQARARLQLVRAGERIYVVGVDPTTTGETGESAKPAWYQQVWSSVQTADDPPVR
jgi:cell division protein FtsB